MKKKKILGMALFAASVIALLAIFRQRKKASSVYCDAPNEKNPMEGKRVIFVEDDAASCNADGVRGYLKAVEESSFSNTFYGEYVKRGLDLTLSFLALILLSPVFLGLSLAIYLDDPGPVFFTQKRVGKNKQYFKLHKFRSMKMSTPHDTPTHMLKNPEQYITGMGKFIRAHSLDELPQIWDIFLGNMSIIGPRPGLWNQDCLIAERDKYHANDVLPGLSGLAQISGRDELEIPEKAKIDGEYVKNIGFLMDARCFLGTIFSVLKREGVVEGGTGKLQENTKAEKELQTTEDEDTGKERMLQSLSNPDRSFKILITGEHSYVGDQVERYLEEYNAKLFPNEAGKKRYRIDTISLFGEEWKEKDFSEYDVVFHVAGIAHQDDETDSLSKKAKRKDVSAKKKESNAEEQYYSVNRDLAIACANKAKAEGVKQFIFMSSMIVYSGLEESCITKDSPLKAKNYYGDSKLQADLALQKLQSETFNMVILRPPMIYGEGCKGNYPKLAKLAKLLPCFPKVGNRRSMLYIGNLAEFIRLLIENRDKGIFFPQNKEYVDTGEMICEIAKAHHRTCIAIPGLQKPLQLMQKLPGKIGRISGKAFSSSYYQKNCSEYREEYRIFSFEDSIKRTEENRHQWK